MIFVTLLGQRSPSLFQRNIRFVRPRGLILSQHIGEQESSVALLAAWKLRRVSETVASKSALASPGAGPIV
jgi:hypothetical protein